MDIDRLIALREQIDDMIDTMLNAENTEAAEELADDASVSRAIRPVLGVIVGHTQVAPGAFAVAPIGQSEYPWNLDLARKIKTAGAAQDVDVRVRLRDKVGIRGAYDQISEVNPKAIVELHFNAANRAVRGTETLYAFAKSKPWAERLQAEMVAVYNRTGKSNRGLKRRVAGDRGFESVSQLPEIPTALIEPFFGDNTTDAKAGQTQKDNLAAAIIAAFLKL